MNNKRIIIFGFSGSGKSTIANLLGKELNLRVIHPSGILRDLINGKEPNISKSKHGRGFWESSKGIQMFKSRLNSDSPIDFVCDQILLKEFNKGNVVIDSWSLPWLTSKGIKIYLRANLKTRVARVSQRSRVSLLQAKKVVRMKDTNTRKLYLDHKGFDIKNDLNVFDLVINTDRLSKNEVILNIQKFIN